MKNEIRKHPLLVTLFLTITGYVLVIGTLSYKIFDPIYPELSRHTVDLLSHIIAINNLITTVLLILGWMKIRNGNTNQHPVYMSVAFILILVFLILYLLKTGGGGRKEFMGPSSVKPFYLFSLFVHIVLSIVSVPLVIYTFVLGLTQTVPEVFDTNHATIGRFAAGFWIVSLVLGLVSYVLLHHVYSYQFVPA